MNEPDVKRIRQAVFQLINARSAEEVAQAQLKQRAKDVRDLEFEIIPELMHELGVNKISLDGFDLQIKNYYRASIPEYKREEAFEWLRTNGFDSLIKREIRTKFVRGQDKLATKLIKFVTDNGWTYDDSEQVNHATLTAWLREQIEKGNASIPLDTLGAYIGERAILKENEKV